MRLQNDLIIEKFMSAIQEFTFFFLPENYPRREARIYFQENKFFGKLF